MFNTASNVHPRGAISTYYVRQARQEIMQHRSPARKQRGAKGGRIASKLPFFPRHSEVVFTVVPFIMEWNGGLRCIRRVSTLCPGGSETTARGRWPPWQGPAPRRVPDSQSGAGCWWQRVLLTAFHFFFPLNQRGCVWRRVTDSGLCFSLTHPFCSSGWLTCFRLMMKLPTLSAAVLSCFPSSDYVCQRAVTPIQSVSYSDWAVHCPIACTLFSDWSHRCQIACCFKTICYQMKGQFCGPGV